MYLSSYCSGEGEITAAPFAFPMLSQIFISYGMGIGVLDPGVGLRSGHGHAGGQGCVRNLALTAVTGQTPGSAGSHLAKLTVIITAGVPEDVLGLPSPLIQLGNRIQLQRGSCTYFPYHHPQCHINTHLQARHREKEAQSPPFFRWAPWGVPPLRHKLHPLTIKDT